MIHAVVKLFVVCDIYSYELLVCTVCYCVLELVEVLYKGISFVCGVFGSEPMKVVAVGDDKYGLIIYPLVEELKIP